jgi:hypothetical protein
MRRTEPGGKRASVRARVVLLTIAVALVAAVVPAGASAFSISSFSLTPSTTQAAGHPNTTISIGFSGGQVRDLTLDLPPGMIGNPETKAKCSQTAFRADACPSSSSVGTVKVIAAALGLLNLQVPGTVYVLEPESGDAATLGIVVRATGGLPIVGKIFSVAHFTAVPNGAGDYFLRSTIKNLPNTATAVLGLVPVPLTLRQLTLSLKAAGNSPGAYFLTNPTGCDPATSAAQAVSYSNEPAGAQSSFTPTGCGAVPFSPSFAFATTSTQAGTRTAPTVTITLPGNEDPLRQSHVRSVLLRFPPGLSLDILSAFGVPTCSDSAFAADSCGPGTRIGTVNVAVPPLPPDFTGDVYRVSPGTGDAYGFGVVLRGPRGLKALVRGGASLTSIVTPEGYMLQVVSSFPSLPEIPFTSFRLSITLPFFVNPATCGTRDASGSLAGWSGASAGLSAPYTTTGC